jgi:hypothetical protein
MREVKITLYHFDELSLESQQVVLGAFHYINTKDTDWWKEIKEDLDMAALTLFEFDVDRGFTRLEFSVDAEETAILISESHGRDTETWKATLKFLQDYVESRGNIDSRIASKKYYLKQLEQAYTKMFTDAYKLWISDEKVIETINNRGYEFTSDGNIYRG